MSKVKKKGIWLSIYIILLVGLVVIIYVLPQVGATVTRTVMLENDTLSISDEVTGYIVRNETVFISEKTGTSKVNVGEGVKVLKGAKILKVEGQKDEKPSPRFSKIAEKLGTSGIPTADYRAGMNGVVTYFVDGNEGFFTTENMRTFQKEDLSDISTNYKMVQSKNIKTGDPAFKVYDNSEWYIVFWVGKDSQENYKKNNGVTIRFQDASLPGTIVSKKAQSGDSWRIIVSSDRYYENLAKSRAENVEIVTAERTGIVIDNCSIDEQDGQKGVYVGDMAGSYNFKPINVLLTDGEKSVIAENFFYDTKNQRVETVHMYDEILRKP